ncbi:MAG: helix-turn-helix domain-containing protein [Ruminococcaceae bacterium]|nr:helix-turn-helix domain-containing protein [Oscillospiraceae bacterium]
MSNEYNFKIPTITNYEVNYYFSDTETLCPARIYPFHMHDSIEIYILLEGDVSFAVESSLYKLSAGDAIITKPNEMHNCILNSDSLHKHLCFWFDCGSGFLFGDFLSHDFGKNNLVSPDAESKKTLSNLYEELKGASDAGDTHRQFYITLQILYILRKFVSGESSPQILPDSLTAILRDIDENFSEIKRIEDIVSKHFISRSTLNRLFREYLHTTPKKYLESKRLAYSRMLLREGKSVLDACMEAGFSDCSNYIRLFRKHFDITPKQYKDSKKF